VSGIEVDAVIAALRQRIVERRLAGDYPVGLEQQLESEFHGMMRAIDRHEIDTSRLGDLADGVRATAHDVRVVGATDSRVPGGSAAHGAVGRVVQRHVQPVAESVRQLSTSVADALAETRRLFEAQSAADERQLLDAVAGVLDRLAVLDHLVEITQELEERVAGLEAQLDLR
jgi:hypothetical protein